MRRADWAQFYGCSHIHCFHPGTPLQCLSTTNRSLSIEYYKRYRKKRKNESYLDAALSGRSRDTVGKGSEVFARFLCCTVLCDLDIRYTHEMRQFKYESNIFMKVERFWELCMWMIGVCVLRTLIFPRDAMLARYMLSSCVRPSVRLSVTNRCSTKMAKPRITKTTPYDSPETPVFWCQKYRRN